MAAFEAPDQVGDPAVPSVWDHRFSPDWNGAGISA
jgi:hypothetical protein